MFIRAIMDPAWDVAIEMWERGRAKLARVSDALGPGLTAAGVLLCVLLVWYTVWAFGDRAEACATAFECDNLTHRDRLLRSAIGTACVVRREDCDASPLLRGPSTLLRDMYMPLYSLVINTGWFIFWTYGLNVLAMIPIVVLVLFVILLSDKMYTLVRPALRIVQRVLHVGVDHKRVAAA